VNAIDADPEVPDEIPPRVPRGAGGLHVAGAAEFLLENRSANGVNLEIDGGWLLQ